MDDRSRNSEAQVYATNLEYTLKELQRKVREHEAELEKIRSTQEETPLPPEGQANVIKSALEEVTNSEPFLPFPGSVLPALVALRKTHQTIVESNAYLVSQGSDVERAKRQLESDRANLKDQQVLTDALNARIQSLRGELDSQAELPPEDGARKQAEELKAKKKGYDKEMSKLMKTLRGFIDDQLAAMLAAEELGGPVVGNVMDLDPEDLAAGFNTQGKLKKAKNGVNQDKRQRRIDDIWGAADDQGGQREAGDEVAAAGKEMQHLTEELLNTLFEAKGDNSASYVTLARESAAARFLVRSKVATFHPKDAMRLRLVDFGRELEN